MGRKKLSLILPLATLKYYGCQCVQRKSMQDNDTVPRKALSQMHLNRSVITAVKAFVFSSYLPF